MMGHRTGTPMRLVSPAPVLVQQQGGGPPPRPQAPTIYQPAQGTPQTIYSQQNNSNNIGGKRFLSIYTQSIRL
jgi:pumilio RNA-binding family